ncbi:MAG: hypothetical protein HYX84_04910 [Chloroflexi bacterium]|nr:hypothetical protein [Chloroflexota bacterium]
MAATYDTAKDNIVGVYDRLAGLAKRMDEIRLEDRRNYPNPRLRSWSGNAKDLGTFADGMDEWIRQPEAAEARRLLTGYFRLYYIQLCRSF